MSPEWIFAINAVIVAITGLLTWLLSKRRLTVEEDSLTVTGSLKLVETAMAQIDYLDAKMVEQRNMLVEQEKMIDEYRRQLKALRRAVRTLHDFIAAQGLESPIELDSSEED